MPSSLLALKAFSQIGFLNIGIKKLIRALVLGHGIGKAIIVHQANKCQVLHC